MNERTLKILLAASVAVNLFALVGGATVYVMRQKAEARIEAQATPGRTASFQEIVQGLDPEVRERVRSTLRASALAAKPDFEEARQARREAVALTADGQPLDQTKLTGLLDRSRAAELRGRQHLEKDAVALLATLDPKDRAALGEMLMRRGRGGGRDGHDGRGARGGHGPRDGSDRRRGDHHGPAEPRP